MKTYFLLFLTIIALSCKNNPPEKTDSEISILTKKEKNTTSAVPINWHDYDIRIQPLELSYQETRAIIRSERQKLATLDLTDAKVMQRVQAYFIEALVNELIPYWYETPWDFNGHTNEPRKGKIACGYFISTTLKHLGIVINRYKLAQQAPLEEAQSLLVDDALITIEGANFELAYEKMQAQLEEGLYFIGLDQSHVGYLLKRKGALFFIHSNYLSPSEVCIEQAEKSTVLSSFTQFYIAPLSRNVSLLKKWLRQERVSVKLT